MHDEILADDYFKTAEFCSMSGPKYWPMHNFRGIDWERLGAAVEKQGQGTPSLAGFADSLRPSSSIDRPLSSRTYTSSGRALPWRGGARPDRETGVSGVKLLGRELGAGGGWLTLHRRRAVGASL
jgi:hypothetical protein